MDSLAPSRFFKCIFVSNNKKSQLHFPTFMPKIAIKKLRQNCTKRGMYITMYGESMEEA